jgi:hypothetical protein
LYPYGWYTRIDRIDRRIIQGDAIDEINKSTSKLHYQANCIILGKVLILKPTKSENHLCNKKNIPLKTEQPILYCHGPFGIDTFHQEQL